MTSRITITAVYPGTFDPITLGHEDLMRRAAGMFERLVIAVAVGHHKKTLFPLDERLAMAQEAAAPLGNVEVIAFDGLLRDFVRTHAGRVVVRGLRTGGDFEYEFQMAGMNRKLMPEVETIFLTPGETTLPFDLDMISPCASATIPWCTRRRAGSSTPTQPASNSTLVKKRK